MMGYSRPRIKNIYPVYKLDKNRFRIGAQMNITREFEDPTGQLWDFVKRLDGRELPLIEADLQAIYPEVTHDDIVFALELLDKEGFIEEYQDVNLVEERYMSNVNYFRRYLGSYDESLTVQRKLNESSILLLGLGGGGSNILSLLAGIGPKKLTIVDYDKVESSNLGRQLLYKEDDIGKLKTETALREFQKMNSSVSINAITKKITSVSDVVELLDGIDLVICAIDEPPFVAQRIVNEAIVKVGVPCVFGGSQVSRGRVYSVIPKKTGCFDCLNIHYTKTSPNFIDQFIGFQKIKFDPPTIAYAPAILQLCSAIVDESVRLLTKYTEPMSLSTQFEINYETGASFCHKPWPRYEDECPTCGKGTVSEWEIFNHYNS